MKKFILLLSLMLSLISYLIFPFQALAISDPLSVPNNKFGVHILFPQELQQAAKLVNSSGGDWGYVIIPIQSGDKNIKKWQDFFDTAHQLHMIPIIRLATEGDYFNNTAWRKPVFTDVLDFANFLNSLTWPTKNRYIVVYNEVNRNDEWGGEANPTEYAQILSYAVTAFKSRSQDFFIISAGLDNASSNGNGAINEYTFLQAMDSGVPGIFNQIDGIGSHSYPNPAFSQPPNSTGRESVASFLYEQSFMQSVSNRKLPVFITETGWSKQTLPEDVVSQYFSYAFANSWNDPSIVAVTPFLLTAGTPPFSFFSLLSGLTGDTKISTTIKNIPKSKGAPVLASDVLAAETSLPKSLPTKHFETRKDIPNKIAQLGEAFFKTILHL